MISCFIVDDEPMARKLLIQYAEKISFLTLKGTAASGLEALTWLQDNTVDLLFLDVQMPELTGMGLLKILKNKPQVILTTAYSEYAIDGYALDVADYLLKPITFERFLMAAEKINQRLVQNTLDASAPLIMSENSLPKEDHIFIKDGNKSVRVTLSDIQYIEGLKDYVRIHTPERIITTLQSLKHLVAVLPSQDFVRIHHSCIVGVRWINEVHRDEVDLAGTMLTVSDTYRPGLKDFVASREL